MERVTPLEWNSGSFSLCGYSVLWHVGSQTVEKGGLLGECRGTEHLAAGLKCEREWCKIADSESLWSGRVCSAVGSVLSPSSAFSSVCTAQHRREEVKKGRKGSLTFFLPLCRTKEGGLGRWKSLFQTLMFFYFRPFTDLWDKPKSSLDFEVALRSLLRSCPLPTCVQ